MNINVAISDFTDEFYYDYVDRVNGKSNGKNPVYNSVDFDARIDNSNLHIHKICRDKLKLFPRK